MRCRIAAALVAVALAHPAYALPSLFIIPPLIHTQPQVRTLRAPAAALLESARERSATVRRLLDEIAATDVIVYLEVARDPRIPRARTALLSSDATRRFLLVTVNPGFNKITQASLLGHELQHVLEIGRTHDVFDQNSLRRFYQRIGRDGQGRDRFETTAAEVAGRHVFDEVSASFRTHADVVRVVTGKDGG